MNEQNPIAQTREWVNDVVVGENFCPFARREVVNNRIRYTVAADVSLEELVMKVVQECELLDKNDDIETTLIIVPDGLADFSDFLSATAIAEAQLVQSGYEGIYQLASFHPHYCFEGESEDDAANYTNRSPYPTFHLIREESISNVLEHVDDPDAIPERNISHARALGVGVMRARLAKILGK